MLLRLKSKLICFDLLLRINNLALWLIQKGNDKMIKYATFYCILQSSGAYVTQKKQKDQILLNQQLEKYK